MRVNFFLYLFFTNQSGSMFSENVNKSTENVDKSTENVDKSV